MSLAIQNLLDGGTPDAGRIDEFLRAHEFPIVEGRKISFVYRGDADDVRLRHWVYGLPSSQPLTRVEGTDLWYLVVDIPEGSRFEYKIERIAGDDREWLMDPLNPKVARDPFGANSVGHAAGYETPDWTRADDEARRGTIEPVVFSSPTLGMRRLRVYLPARFRRNRRYPLLVVHDGDDYLRYAALRTVLDNLIHRLEIPPMIVALTHSEDRLREYGADPRHAKFLVEELVPELEERYPLIPRPAYRGLLGASFGGVATLHTAWKYPGFFGKLLMQSGSFAFSDIGPHQRGPMWDSVVDFVNHFRDEPGKPAQRVFVNCGTYEPLIYENRSLVPVLQATGMALRYVESRDGHNWENWRDRLREGLSWLFPGPLWMVYE